MINRGDIIILSGKTQKGKNRVKENGAQWVVIKMSEACIALDNKPAAWIEPLSGTDNSRWIHTSIPDPDFQLEGKINDGNNSLQLSDVQKMRRQDILQAYA